MSKENQCSRGCGEPVRFLGLCRAHYREDWRARTATDFTHGTMNGYTNRNCRCEKCRAASRIYWAAKRAKKRAAL